MTTHQHRPNCTGCPICSREMASIPKDAASYARWLTARTASERQRRGLAADAPPSPAAWRNTAWPIVENPTWPTHARTAQLNPPDPWGLTHIGGARR